MNIELYPIVASLAAIAFAIFLSWKVNQFPEGKGKMIEIAGAIKEGARAYLNRQYKTVACVAVIIALVLYFFLGFNTAIGFLIGATASALAGYIGMNVAVRANVRTARRSQKRSSDRP